MKANWYKFALIGYLALFLTACGQVGTPVPADEPPPPPSASLPLSDTQSEPQKESLPMTQPPQPSSGMESLIEKAKEDLAQRLSIATTEISLVETREVVWPDASLGCPQPGMKYKQVPEDGALIVLEAQGVTYEYHNGGSRGLFLCEKVYKDPNPPPKIDITDLTPRLQDNNNPPPTTPDNSIPPGEDQ